MERHPLFAFAAGAALAAFGQVDTASACSIDSCQPPLRLPVQQYMPGNLVYFEVTAPTPGSITLRTAAGEAIPAGIRTIGNDRVFASDAPIPAQTDVVLEYELFCFDGGTAPLPTGAFEFRTEEHRSIELRPAQLFVYEYGVQYPGLENNERGYVRIGMDSPDLNQSAHHLMTHTATVDGVSITGWPVRGALTPFEVGSQCLPEWPSVQTDSCGGLWSVPTGRHTVSVQTRVLGYDGAIEPVTLEIETRCPPADDGSVPADDTPPEPRGDEDSLSESDDGPEGSDRPRDHAELSCAIGSGAAPSHPSVALATLALGMVAWRRRRQRG